MQQRGFKSHCPFEVFTMNSLIVFNTTTYTTIIKFLPKNICSQTQQVLDGCQLLSLLWLYTQPHLEMTVPDTWVKRLTSSLYGWKTEAQSREDIPHWAWQTTLPTPSHPIPPHPVPPLLPAPQNSAPSSRCQAWPEPAFQVSWVQPPLLSPWGARPSSLLSQYPCPL